MVAPDLPGYGRSDKPDVTYDCEWINACLSGIADGTWAQSGVYGGRPRLGRAPRVDHGAPVPPGRVAGVIGVNTPDLPRSPMPPVQLLRQIFVDTPIYIIQFQERGLAEWVLSWGRGVDDFVEMIFAGAGTKNLDVPARGARRVQARVPAGRRAHAAARVLPQHGPQLGAHRADRGPHDRRAMCLMISAADDPVLTPAMTLGMEERVPNLERVVIENCGHWTQQERPEETSAAMLAYLRRLDAW